MATFQDRALRVPAAFPVSFSADRSDETEIIGSCVNISESGLLGEFGKDLELWTKGEVVLRFGEGALGLRVRVARVEGKQAGLVFLFDTDEQRRLITEVVASAAAEMRRKGHSASVPF